MGFDAARAGVHRRRAVRRQGARHPSIVPGGAERVRARAARTYRRIRGSHAVERHPAQGLGDADRGIARRELCAFRRARIRDVGDSQRRRRPRRLHSLRRHVPGLLGLCAQCVAHGGPDAARHDLRLHPRFDRTRRRRSDASADRTSGEPARDPGHGRVASVRRGRDRGRVARRASKIATGPPAWC